MAKRCNGPNCNKQPSFNYLNETKALYCKEHKKDNMVDIKSKRCNGPNCNTRPTFNYSNEIIALYCSLHKKENIWNKDQIYIQIFHLSY